MLTSSPSPSLHAKSQSPRRPPAPYRSPLAPSATSHSSSSASAATASIASPGSSKKIASTSPAARPHSTGISASLDTAQTRTVAAKTVDTGTQYSPPDWPPTSSRSSLRSALTAAAAPNTSPTARAPPAASNPGGQQRPQEPPTPAQKVAPKDLGTDGDRGRSPPAEPDARIPPTTIPQNAIRRPLSTESSTESNTTSASTESKKRARHGDAASANLKVLPADYSQCPAKTLAAIIATMLMRLIAHNDRIPLVDGHLTRFHSRAPPGISVHDYLARLTFHGTLSPPILLSMVFFVDRLSSNYAKFIINSLTVHRFLITAATAASKGLSDSFWTNSVYARVGGVSVKELALLELELLMQCDWKIVPKQEELVNYYRGLVRQSDEFVLEGDDEAASAKADGSGTPVRGAISTVAGHGSSPRTALDLAENNHLEKNEPKAKESNQDADPMDTSDGNG